MSHWLGHWPDQHWPDQHWLGVAEPVTTQARIYYETVLAELVEIPNVRVCVLTMQATEVDNTPRENAGWRNIGTTSRDCMVDFEMIWKPNDVAFDAIWNAYEAGEPIVLLVLDDDVNMLGAQGPRGDFAIVSFSRNEMNDKAITVSVTAKLAQFDEWIII